MVLFSFCGHRNGLQLAVRLFVAQAQHLMVMVAIDNFVFGDFFPGSLCLCLGLSFHSLNEIKSNSLQTNRILFEVASNFFRPYLFADGRCITPQRIHCLNVSLPLEQ